MKKLLLSIFVLCISASTYAQTPSWVFSRASVAKKSFSTGGIRDTAINVPRVADGIELEGQRINRCSYSETFNSWSLNECTISSNSLIAPDGTTTADGIIGSINNTQHFPYVIATGLNAGYVTYSVYAKPGNKNWIRITSGTFGIAAYFNLSNGSIGTVLVGSTAKIESVGDGWYRCSVSANFAAGGNASIYLISADSDGDDTFVGDAATINTYAWGAQAEDGAFPTSYCGPTGAGLVTCTADSMTMVPNHGSKNIIKYSNEPERDGAGNPWFWVRATGSTTGSTSDPNGGWNARAIREDNTPASTHYIYQNVTTVAGHVYTFSGDMKAINRNWAEFESFDGALHKAYFDLGTGTVGSVSNAVSSITSLGSGWYRCTMTYSASGTSYFEINVAEANNDNIFDGVIQTSVAVFDFQVEEGPVFTTYNETYATISPTMFDILPQTFSATGPYSKLTIQFDFKASWSSSADMIYDIFFYISGSVNYISIYSFTNGIIYMKPNAALDIRSVADTVNYSRWHTYKVFIDYADLSRSYFSIDGVNCVTYIGAWVGTETFSPTSIQLLGIGSYDNLRIEPKEF